MIPRAASTDSLLLVVDVQEKLLAKMPGAEGFQRNIELLLDAADALDVPIAATEQYPKGLGPTIQGIAQRLKSPALSKTAFSCCGAEGFLAELRVHSRHNVILVGMETHVCIAQTAFDLMNAGFGVFVPVDAVASRREIDRETALRRMELAGCIPTTCEAIVFEWLRDAAHRQFKTVSKLVVDRANASA